MAAAMSVSQMADHVRDLADEHHIAVEHYRGSGAAYRRARLVRIAPVKGISSYFTALHELGHIVGPGRSARKLEREANAWEWAIIVAQRPPTDAVSFMIARSLRSYLHAGRRSHGLRQNMVEPDSGHVFWALCNAPLAVQRLGAVQPLIR
jgi:hypothetical protein